MILSGHALKHPRGLKTSLLQMITNNTMSHKCVEQQVVAYESLRMPGAVAYESF